MKTNTYEKQNSACINCHGDWINSFNSRGKLSDADIGYKNCRSGFKEARNKTTCIMKNQHEERNVMSRNKLYESIDGKLWRIK